MQIVTKGTVPGPEPGHWTSIETYTYKPLQQEHVPPGVFVSIPPCCHFLGAGMFLKYTIILALLGTKKTQTNTHRPPGLPGFAHVAALRVAFDQGVVPWL